MDMRTTLDLDDAKIAELMRALDVHTKTEAINRAIEECLRAHRRRQLKELAGKVELDEDWRTLRDRDQ